MRKVLPNIPIRDYVQNMYIYIKIYYKALAYLKNMTYFAGYEKNIT